MFLLAGLEGFGDQLPELASTGAKSDGAGEIHDQDVPHFPVKMFEGHAATVAPWGCRCQHSDRMKLPRFGRVAQLVRAPRLHRGGPGFESLRAHQTLHCQITFPTGFPDE